MECLLHFRKSTKVRFNNHSSWSTIKVHDGDKPQDLTLFINDGAIPETIKNLEAAIEHLKSRQSEPEGGNE